MDSRWQQSQRQQQMHWQSHRNNVNRWKFAQTQQQYSNIHPQTHNTTHGGGMDRGAPVGATQKSPVISALTGGFQSQPNEIKLAMIQSLLNSAQNMEALAVSATQQQQQHTTAVVDNGLAPTDVPTINGGMSSHPAVALLSHHQTHTNKDNNDKRHHSPQSNEKNTAVDGTNEDDSDENIVKCQYCNTWVTKAALPTHYDNCAMYLVQCPVCKQQLTRVQLTTHRITLHPNVQYHFTAELQPTNFSPTRSQHIHPSTPNRHKNNEFNEDPQSLTSRNRYYIQSQRDLSHNTRLKDDTFTVEDSTKSVSSSRATQRDLSERLSCEPSPSATPEPTLEECPYLQLGCTARLPPSQMIGHLNVSLLDHTLLQSTALETILPQLTRNLRLLSQALKSELGVATRVSGTPDSQQQPQQFLQPQFSFLYQDQESDAELSDTIDDGSIIDFDSNPLSGTRKSGRTDTRGSGIIGKRPHRGATRREKYISSEREKFATSLRLPRPTLNNSVNVNDVRTNTPDPPCPKDVYPEILEVYGKTGFNSDLNGIYHVMPRLHRGKPAYKRLDSTWVIRWSSNKSEWMLDCDGLKDDDICNARVCQECSHPGQITKPWLVYNNPHLEPSTVKVKVIAHTADEAREYRAKNGLSDPPFPDNEAAVTPAKNPTQTDTGKKVVRTPLKRDESFRNSSGIAMDNDDERSESETPLLTIQVLKQREMNQKHFVVEMAHGQNETNAKDISTAVGKAQKNLRQPTIAVLETTTMMNGRVIKHTHSNGYKESIAPPPGFKPIVNHTIHNINPSEPGDEVSSTAAVMQGPIASPMIAQQSSSSDTLEKDQEWTVSPGKQSSTMWITSTPQRNDHRKAIATNMENSTEKKRSKRVEISGNPTTSSPQMKYSAVVSQHNNSAQKTTQVMNQSPAHHSNQSQNRSAQSTPQRARRKQKNVNHNSPQRNTPNHGSHNSNYRSTNNSYNSSNNGSPPKKHRKKKKQRNSNDRNIVSKK